MLYKEVQFKISLHKCIHISINRNANASELCLLEIACCNVTTKPICSLSIIRFGSIIRVPYIYLHILHAHTYIYNTDWSTPGSLT